MHKLDALTRILEAEPFDAMIIFARTKQATEELAGKLQARGWPPPPSTATSPSRSASG
jgi:ATP-dependent RNA helicase CsdA (EC 5.99.1.-)